MRQCKFYNSDREVVAVSSFAGKPVRATAKCDPSDTFSIDSGKELAAARCESKIAHRRCKCAKAKLERALAEANKAQEQLDFAISYYKNATNDKESADKAVAKILEKLGA